MENKKLQEIKYKNNKTKELLKLYEESKQLENLKLTDPTYICCKVKYNNIIYEFFKPKNLKLTQFILELFILRIKEPNAIQLKNGHKANTKIIEEIEKIIFLKSYVDTPPK